MFLLVPLTIVNHLLSWRSVVDNHGLFYYGPVLLLPYKYTTVKNFLAINVIIAIVRYWIARNTLPNCTNSAGGRSAPLAGGAAGATEAVGVVDINGGTCSGGPSSMPKRTKYLLYWKIVEETSICCIHTCRLLSAWWWRWVCHQPLWWWWEWWRCLLRFPALLLRRPAADS